MSASATASTTFVCISWVGERSYRITRTVTGDQVNVEIQDIARLDGLDGIDIILVLISPAEIGVAVVVLVG
jgi:hypothetical protein